jgi:hypothetical protein
MEEEIPNEWFFAGYDEHERGTGTRPIWISTRFSFELLALARGVAFHPVCPLDDDRRVRALAPKAAGPQNPRRY